VNKTKDAVLGNLVSAVNMLQSCPEFTLLIPEVRVNLAYALPDAKTPQEVAAVEIRRRQEGKMYFYSADPSNAAIIEFKKLINLMLIEPLVEELKRITSRVALYGSCAQGTDTSRSDLDLFIVSNDKEKVAEVVGKFSFPQGFEDVHIQPVVKSPAELLDAGESEQAFLNEVERGIVLWERAASESRV